MWAIAFVAACNDITDPVALPPYLRGGAAGLEFSTEISKTAIRLGDTATVTIRLRNPQTQQVRLSFSSGCSVLPYISAGDKQIVYPSGGGWACTAMLSSLTIAAGGEYVVKLPVRGGAPTQSFYNGAALSPGRYLAYAEINDDLGRSNAVPFSVVK